MSKATNNGTCQCCGSVQKLPSGKLSKHGYTVDYGWFNGVCRGAGELPFEQSKDLIEAFIDEAQKEIESTQNQINELIFSTDHKKVWKHSYIDYRQAASNGKKSGYIWEQRELICQESYRSSEYNEFVYIYADDECKPKGFNASIAAFSRKGDKTLDDVVKQENQKYINNVLKKKVAGLASYIEWQNSRIQNWKSAELLPL